MLLFNALHRSTSSATSWPEPRRTFRGPSAVCRSLSHSQSWESPPSKRARTQFPRAPQVDSSTLNPDVPEGAEALALAESRKLIVDIFKGSLSTQFCNQWQSGGPRWAHFTATNWSRLNVGSIRRICATLARPLAWNNSQPSSCASVWSPGAPVAALTSAEFLEP